MTGYRPDYGFLEALDIAIADDVHRTPVFDEATFETSRPGIYLAGTVCGGYHTSRWFIENGRFHAQQIVKHITRGTRGHNRLRCGALEDGGIGAGRCGAGLWASARRRCGRRATTSIASARDVAGIARSRHGMRGSASPKRARRLRSSTPVRTAMSTNTRVPVSRMNQFAAMTPLARMSR